MIHLTDDQLNEYLDAALPDSARRSFEAHLQGCGECRARLGALQYLFIGLAGLPEARPSADLAAVVLARLPQRQPPLWSREFAAQAGAALGALVWLTGEAVRAIQIVEPASIQLLLVQFLALPGRKPPLPEFRFLDLGSAETSAFNLALLAASALALWVTGNAMLLRGRRNLSKRRS
jgi:hypothetical protein